MSSPAPIATGTLAKTPLPQLFAYLDQKKLSGTLAIWPDPVEGGEPQGQDRILLLKGVPVAGRLLETTTVLRPALLKLFAREQAPYAFYESNLLGDDRISGRVDTLSLITEAARAHVPASVIAQIVDRLAGVRLRITPGTDLARYELQPEERALVELLLAEPADVASLVLASGQSEERVRRFAYVLVLTKAAAAFEVKAEAPAAEAHRPSVAAPAAEAEAPEAAAPHPAVLPEDGPAAPSLPPMSMPSMPPDGNSHSRLDRLQNMPPPPETLAEDLRQKWLRIATKGRLIENQNYFEMLEIDKDTKSPEARSKFYQMAKDWHPDRLPNELQSLREHVQVIFSYMSEANAQLGDEQQRIKYVQTVREGGGTPATERMMQMILETAMEYERVLVMARRHEYDHALELMTRILSLVNDDPEYHAMYAWLLLQKFPGTDAPMQKMMDSVEKALAIHARHERANLLKAQILRRQGRQEEALQYFRTVAEINPRNVDAVREVRVATMRSQKSGGGAPIKGKGGKGGQKDDPSSVGGLLGKFFKK